MSLHDTLQSPIIFDPTRSSYKDWFHLNLIDFETKALGIFNTSLHGDPLDQRSMAAGSAFISQGLGWIGNVEVVSQLEANMRPNFIGLQHMGFLISSTTPSIHVGVRQMDNRLNADFIAKAVSSYLSIDLPMPFGKGWISWRLIPKLQPFGILELDGKKIRLDNRFTAYHDHNWGRWFWGDDIGWEWGYFQCKSLSAVFARTTNRAHSIIGATWFSIHREGPDLIVSPGEIDCKINLAPKTLRRVPGAMAALRQDRANPLTPQSVTVCGKGSSFDLRFSFTASDALQFIAADPAGGGCSFIHETSGNVIVDGIIGNQDISEEGCAILEYVN